LNVPKSQNSKIIACALEYKTKVGKLKGKKGKEKKKEKKKEKRRKKKEKKKRGSNVIEERGFSEK
jgi:major membrane immunogen (membrane-anchored lipoprotein)